MFQPISRNTQGGTAHHIFKILFRQLGSAEEPFSEYEKNFEKPVHFRRRKVRNGDNTNLWATLMRLLSETMCMGFTPGGDTLIFSHIRRLGNSEFQYFFLVFRKMNTFWGYEDFVDIFGGSPQNWASFYAIEGLF